MEESSWDEWHSEQLVLCRDDEVGLRAAIAIDDTTLGPGLGGVRCVSYPSDVAGIIEAQRLAAAMTLKNAFAGLPYGGAKSVIIAPTREIDRHALMQRFGRFVMRTGGAYLPGVDMGTSVTDLQAMADAGADVSCDEEDPSPWTAVGVAAATRAAIENVDRREGIEGTRVLIQGAGHVGAALARDLARDGAEIVLADINAERAARVAAEVRRHHRAAAEALSTECDVFSPCSVAKVVTPSTVRRMNCRMIVGRGQRHARRSRMRRAARRARDHLRAGLRFERRRRDPHPQPARRLHDEARCARRAADRRAHARRCWRRLPASGQTPLRVATERVRQILADARSAADGARSSGAARRGKTRPGTDTHEHGHAAARALAGGPLHGCIRADPARRHAGARADDARPALRSTRGVATTPASS